MTGLVGNFPVCGEDGLVVKKFDDKPIPPKSPIVVKVFDAMMGSGKTETIIRDMGVRFNKDGSKFLYITPLIDECHRIAGTYYDEDDELKRPVVVSSEDNGEGVELDLYDYNKDHPLSSMFFKHPDYKGGNKADNLKNLIKYQHNIVSTHQLFKQLTPDLLKQAGDYVLVIDEALQVYDVFGDISEKELKALIKYEVLYVDVDELTLRFDRTKFGNYSNFEDDDGDFDNTHYGSLANLCDLGQLLYVNGKVLVWELSLETLMSFKEVWVATYLFEGSQMATYFKGHGVEYELIQFGKSPQDIRHLINIYGYEDDMSASDIEKNASSGLNAVGYKNTSLSSSAISRDKEEVCNQLRKNLLNFFINKTNSKKDDRLWTSLKSLIKPVGDKRYQSDWLAFNTKATNDYGNVHNLAYLMNLYAQPFIVHASQKKGYPIDQDIYALSEMIQWIWRSAIRNGEEINLYIPSSRMRNLLVQWLNGGFVASIPHTEIKTVV